MADMLSDCLYTNRIPPTSIHGDRSQCKREVALQTAYTGRMPILVATAIAACGLDIPNVTHVINYDLPSNINDYIHCISFTSRVGSVGISTAFFNCGNKNIVRDLLELLREASQEIPTWLETVAHEASFSMGYGDGCGGGRGGRGGGRSASACDYRSSGGGFGSSKSYGGGYDSSHASVGGGPQYGGSSGSGGQGFQYPFTSNMSEPDMTM
jgi:ATP-dependent RNA helicase DDX3X